MKPNTVQVFLISPFGAGVAGIREVTAGTPVGTFVSNETGVPLDNVLIRVNRQNVSLFYVLCDGDRITVSPNGIHGEVWVPTLKVFKNYLRGSGFQFARSGKGDHEIWQAHDGNHLAVNASKRDKKHVDIATVRQLAELKGISFQEVIADILEWATA